MSPTVFMMWGLATGIPSSTSTLITFPSGGGFPTFGAIPYQIYYTAATNYTNVNASTYISSSTTTYFVFTVPQANYSASIYWLAIGSV